jgi:hypothetical protein
MIGSGWTFGIRLTDSGPSPNDIQYFGNSNLATTPNVSIFRNFENVVYVNTGNEMLVGTTTDAGTYKMQVSGKAYIADQMQVINTSANPAFHLGTFTSTDTRSTFTSVFGQLNAINASATNNTWSKLNFGDGGGTAATVATQIMNAANDYGDLAIWTRAADGLLERMRINGNVTTVNSVMKITPMTTTQRNALTASQGMIIYNSTIDSIQIRTASAWRSL